MLINLLRQKCVHQNVNLCFISVSYGRSFHSHTQKLLNESKNKSTAVKFNSGILKLSKGHIARLADSSATGQFNNTNVLVTIVNKPKYPAASFLPLTVDYLHKASASGRIPSNFNRRDMGSSNYEILVSRMIDRSIRPLFPQTDYNNETQIVCNLLSFDGQDSPDIVCINTVSYALSLSNLTWNGPIGCVRIGMIDNEFIANPSKKQLENSPLNIVLSINEKKDILMIEAWGDDIDQEKFIDALEFGVKEAYKVISVIKWAKKEKDLETNLNSDNTQEKQVEDIKKDEYAKELNKINDKFQIEAYVKLYDTFTNSEHDKKSRDDAISQVRNLSVNSILKKNEEKTLNLPLLYNYQALSNLFMKFAKEIVRNLVLEEQKRVDGRKLKTLRKISCKKDLYPSLHGSSLFTRGQTQVLSTITFDSPETMYKQESIQNMMSPSITNFDKNFMLHYEFPGYAINEISRMGGRADRREIGHGALAEKALYSMIPKDYPFTIRAYCEVLESNGSSSMASVSATSMALMDAGVPIKKAVCGVAMGIITEMNENQEIVKHEILSDISGFEDYMGDMDFKIAGTAEGITAVQADFKIPGLPLSIIKDVIKKSKDARLTILQIMNNSISKCRTDKKDNQPIVKNLDIPIEQRSKLIGIGGLNVRRIKSNTGVTINSNDEGGFRLFAPNKKALTEAETIIDSILTTQREPELEFGGVYTSKVVEIRSSGLMVQFYPNMRPVLLPNSQLDGKKIVHGSASEYEIGDEIQVKYFGRDPVDGKTRISRKALFNTHVASKNFFTPDS